MMWAIVLFFSLVHATDLQDWAENSAVMGPESVAADVSRFLVDAAAATGIVHLKSGLEGVRQRVNDPVVIAKKPSPPPPAPVPEPPAPAPKAAQTLAKVAAPVAAVTAVAANAEARPGKPAVKRVLLVGASSMRHELGAALERTIKGYEGVAVKRFAKAATGLSRPDVFDWPKKLRALIKEFKPDLVIANHGGNDGQNLRLPKKDRAVWGTEKWNAEYIKRVGAFIDIAHKSGAKFINLGMPIMRSKKFSKKMKALNGITKRGTEKVGAIYVDTWDLAADKKGRYQESVMMGKKKRLLRQSDGIHYSTRGGAYVVAKLMPRLTRHVTFGTGKTKSKKKK